eukprot:SAG11_NODE_2639_length_3140_cov_3.871095_2_plen_140_part_00
MVHAPNVHREEGVEVSTARRDSDGGHGQGEDAGAPESSGDAPTAEDGGVQPDGSAQPRECRLQTADPTCNDNDGDDVVAVDTTRHTDGGACNGGAEAETPQQDIGTTAAGRTAEHIVRGDEDIVRGVEDPAAQTEAGGP